MNFQRVTLLMAVNPTLQSIIVKDQGEYIKFQLIRVYRKEEGGQSV